MPRLTLDDLALAVRNEVGRDPSRSTVEALINEAGESWANIHSWAYLRDRSQELELTAGVESYRLGLGVRTVTDIHRPNSTQWKIRLVDYDYWQAERYEWNAQLGRNFKPIATLRYGQEEGDLEPRLYLDIFPVQATETVRIVFQAGWVPLNNRSDVADIPGPLVPSFREWVRMYALTREKPEQYPPGSLDQFIQSRAIKDAMRIDGGVHKGLTRRLTGPGLHYARKRVRSYGHGFYDRTDLLPPDQGDYFA